MNQGFAQAAAAAKQVQVLTHTQEVTRLYRASLRLLNSWAIDRQIFLEEAEEIRASFDLNKGLAPDSVEAANLVIAGQEKLVEYTHPDPYCFPYMPGGSKFMRNPPPPHEVNGGLGEYVNVDGTPAVPGEKEAIIVDFGKKNME